MTPTEQPVLPDQSAPTGGGPVPLQERLHGLDAARGWALLGIFLVNVFLIGWPLGQTMAASEGALDDWAGGLAYHVTSVVAVSRSFPLFSLLFGIGLAVQMERAGGTFGARHVRRLLLLGAFGIAHALLLWFGDILFVYAVGGLLAGWLFFGRSVRTLCVASVVSFVIASLMLAAISILGAAASIDTPSAGPVDAVGDQPTLELLERFGEGAVSDPSDPFWMAAETKAFGQGPFAEAVAMRALLWAISLVAFFVLGGTGLVSLSMFLLGAALHRSGALRDPTSSWPRRMVLVGAAALALSVPLQFGIAANGASVTGAALQTAQTLIGPVVSAGYLGAVLLLLRRPAIYPRFREGLCALGRMALSNYLLQSLIGAAIFQHWGAAQFGRWSLAAGTVLAVVVWLLQMYASLWWLERFQFGPFEWLWRSVTYWRLLPMRSEREVATG
ncbi:MAG: DUF418 domain-containing protein [Planctomycetaceae bacterium]|nr:DUF418 domain-containing protein [Planctomycetaceae bacterium]